MKLIIFSSLMLVALASSSLAAEPKGSCGASLSKATSLLLSKVEASPSPSSAQSPTRLGQVLGLLQSSDFAQVIEDAKQRCLLAA